FPRLEEPEHLLHAVGRRQPRQALHQAVPFGRRLRAWRAYATLVRTVNRLRLLSKEKAIESRLRLGTRDDQREAARAVDALDSRELDGGGRRRPRHEGEGPAFGAHDIGEAANRGRHAVDDLLRLDDADVDVRNQREQTPSLTGAAVEDDRSRLGDPERAAGQS